MPIHQCAVRLRAATEANRLVVDHGAFGDADTISRLADFVAGTPMPQAADLRNFVVHELRARAALALALQKQGRAGT